MNSVFKELKVILVICLSSTYIILAPKAFRPGMSMALQVTILKSPSPVEVKASILDEATKEEVAVASGIYQEGRLFSVNFFFFSLNVETKNKNF